MTHKLLIKISTLFLFILMVGSIQADVASDLTNYVNSVGGAATSTPASIYQGQSRGYINGGRLFARVPQRAVQTMAFKAPKVTAGCGGL